MVLFLNFTPALASIEFNLKDHKGQNHQISELKGKWVVLNYWATWCPPCREEIPLLVDYGNAREDVIIFGINYEPGLEPEKLTNFVDTYFIDYPIIPATKKLVEKFGVPRGLPMTIFISPEGKLVKKSTGMLNKKYLDRIMK